jgi:predicted DNA-binding protein
MPYKDEKLYWKTRLPRTMRPKVEKLAKKQDRSNIALLTEAVDIYITEQENTEL